MPQAPEAVIGCVEQLLASHRLNTDGRGRTCLGRFTQEQVLKADAQLLHHAVLRQLRLIVKASVALWCRLTGSVGSHGNHEQQHSQQEESLHVTPQ
ncbi:hypothetical protein D3C75_978520 [compost metagenome]